MNKEILEEPRAPYGSSIRMEDLTFESMPHMMETLRAQGCITHDELVDRLSKLI